VGDNALPIKQESFSRLVAEGSSQADAYRGSYNAEKMTDKTIWEAASRLMADSKVYARVQEIKDASLQHVKYGIEEHYKELEELRQLALVPRGDNGRIELQAATKATELKGKLKGLYVDKLEANVSGNITVNILAGKKTKE